MAYDNIRRLLRDGYPWMIRGNDGYQAILVDIQPLVDHQYCGIYRYPGGDCCHFLDEIKSCFIAEKQLPDDLAWWIVIVEDGNGKVHRFKALCDDSKPDDDPCSIYSTEERIRNNLSDLSGRVIYSYRERDIIEDRKL